MSTLGNYFFQSFNFRSKSKLRPFYSLVASITAEVTFHGIEPSAFLTPPSNWASVGRRSIQPT